MGVEMHILNSDSPIGSQVNKTNYPIPVIAVTSGKGGVGKTNVVMNLAYSLSLLKQRVVIIDADMGLSNLDVLIGLAPKYTIQHLLTGERAIDDVMVEGPRGIKILPSSSGLEELTELSCQQKITLLSQLEILCGNTDIIFLDTPPGISSNVMFFNTIAGDTVIVVSPEITSIADAYAIIKVMNIRYDKKRFHLLVNLAKNETEGLRVYGHLSSVTERLLNVSISYLGVVPFDYHLQQAVKQQKAVTELFPNCPGSRSFHRLAKRIAAFCIFPTLIGNRKSSCQPLINGPLDQKQGGAL
jgi:flagellar biosynthesis protein FlhG